MQRYHKKTKTASGRHLHRIASDMLYRADKASPNRVWHSPRTGTVARSTLPKSHAKYRPEPGRQSFAKAGSITHDRNGVELPEVEGVRVADHYEQRRGNTGIVSVCTTPKWVPKPGTPKLPF